ncbi:MAG: hypothetical protein JSV88_07285 [Candidatus Aminicenantes bacterium]|nr:MAG: hypothetical protein JSV88_07285 [Candidatus Aminicenantes bacterium]
MSARLIKQFLIERHHCVLHKIQLYYEKSKESSINIKKMKIMAKMREIVFYFKNIFFILKNRANPKEVANG